MNKKKFLRLLYLPMTVCILTLMLFLLFFCLACNSSELSMRIEVSFRSPEFYINNYDTYAWEDVELFLNYEDDDILSGYTYRIGTLLGGENFNGLRFTNSDGKSFNPWLEQPKKMMIRGITYDGKTGVYVKEW